MTVIWIVRVPSRPSRLKTTSTPRVRRRSVLGRSRPASARGLFGQPDRFQTTDLPATLMPACKRSDASSCPLHSVGHDLAHAGRYWVGLDDVLDRLAPIVRISGFEGACRSKGTLTSCGPEREVSHARQSIEAHLRSMRSHARPHRGARQGCAGVRVQTLAKAPVPAGAAAMSRLG